MVNLLFVVGCPRSGTSLMRDLLNTSTEINIPSIETQNTLELVRALSHGDHDSFKLAVKRSPVSFHLPDRCEAVLAINSDKDSVRESFVEMLDLLSDGDKKGGRILGEKSPLNALCLVQLWQLLGPFHVIWITRDPRDVALSAKQAFGHASVDTARLWNQVAEKKLEWFRLNPERSLHVSYESLCANPRLVLEEVGSFLDVAMDLSAYESREQYSSQGPSGAVAPKAVDFRTKLSRLEIWGIQEAVKANLCVFGYEEVAIDAGKSWLSVLSLLTLGDRILRPLRSLGTQVRHKGILGGLAYKLRQIRLRHRNET